MDYQDFIVFVKTEVQSGIGRKYRVTTKQINKNNGIVEEALVINTEGSGLGMTVYVREIYEEYVRTGDMLSCILSIVNYTKNHMAGRGDEAYVKNIVYEWSNVKEYIRPALISVRKNKDLDKSYIYRPYLDLAIIYIVLLPEGGLGQGVIKVTKTLLEKWEQTEAVLYQVAIDNMKKDEYGFQTMAGVLREADIEVDEVTATLNPEMFILSNKQKYYGAVGILNKELLQELSVKMNADLFIMPSSIHESILMPVKPGIKVSDINEMVREINETQLNPIEVLEDHAYYYDRELQEIRIAE